MRALSITFAVSASLLLAACGDPDAIATEGLEKQEETLEDANVRAENLAREAATLDAEAAQAGGAEGRALRERADANLAAGADVADQGEADSDAVGRKTQRDVDIVEGN